MSFLKVEKRDRVTLVTMDRPEQRNALSDTAQCEEFVQICAAIEADPHCASQMEEAEEERLLD